MSVDGKLRLARPVGMPIVTGISGDGETQEATGKEKGK